MNTSLRAVRASTARTDMALAHFQHLLVLGPPLLAFQDQDDAIEKWLSFK